MFSIYKMGVGTSAPFVHLPVTASESVMPGEALKLASGKLTRASGDTAPAYVALGPDENGMVPCAEVQGYMEFETTLSAAPGSGTTLAAGDKLTISADGMEVTATTASGVAKIKYIDGQTVGSTVIVGF
ncbi:hypothetical protein QVN85_04875 [Oscillibacter valericigenes]|nr:hypothetical protein [Oscillibacter valericigenes]